MTIPKDPARKDEYLRLLSESHKGQHSSPATEFKKGLIPHNKGKTLEELYGKERAEEIRSKLRESHKGQKPWNTGKHWPEWVKEKFSKAKKGKPSPNKGRKFSPEWRKKLSEARKRLYRESPEHLRNWFKSLQARPNKSELRSLEILRGLDSNRRYVGDGSLVIDGRCPDFWDGGNRLVELFGGFWHRDDDPQERVDFFARRGYDCVVVWDSELKDVEGVIRKIKTLYPEEVQIEKVQVKQAT